MRKSRFFARGKAILTFYYYMLYWFWIFQFCKKAPIKEPQAFSIGITTFSERYEVLFIDLIKRIDFAFPGVEILVAVNGHFDQQKQEKYLNKITSFCNRFKNVTLITYKHPQGLSKLWNQIILHSNNQTIFVMNDDTLFKNNLKKEITECLNIQDNFALLNDSFSHFIARKTIFEKVGWFDEQFTEIGGEDDDFHVRMVLEGFELKRYRVNGLKNYKPSLKINSYGMKTKDQANGYSNLNTKVLLEKWDIRNEQFFGAKFIEKSQGNYWKLR